MGANEGRGAIKVAPSIGTPINNSKQRRVFEVGAQKQVFVWELDARCPGLLLRFRLIRTVDPISAPTLLKVS